MKDIPPAGSREGSSAARRRSRWLPKVGNGTVYIDVPVPFSNVVLICDLGRYLNLGWRRKR